MPSPSLVYLATLDVPMYSKRLASFFVLALAAWTGSAMAVYRCEGHGDQPVTYSQWPCSDSARIKVLTDQRSEAQRAQAAGHHAIAQKEAARFDRRQRREARARKDEQATAIDGPVRQVSAGNAERENRLKPRRLEAHEPDRVVRPPRPFRALEPKKESSASDRQPSNRLP